MKATYIFYFLCLFSQNIFAQTPTLEWISTSTNSPHNEVPIGMTIDPDGNIVTSGHFMSLFADFGSQHLINSGAAGTSDMYMVKYDQGGNAISSQTNGGSGGEWIRNTAFDAGGNMYVSGIFSSTTLNLGSTSINLTGCDDSFIIKYDALGNLIWVKTMGGPGRELIIDMKINTDGIYFCGSFDGAYLTIGGTTFNNSVSSGSRDAFVMKMDFNGNLVWAHPVAGSGDEIADKIRLDSSGNVYLNASYNGASLNYESNTIPNTSGFYNSFLAKLNSDGLYQWSHQIGQIDDVYGTAIEVDNQGNIYQAGYFDAATITLNGASFTNNSNSGYADYFLTKYDPSGQILWAQTGGGNSAEIPTAICFDSGNNLYMTGYHYSSLINFGTMSVSGGGMEDIFILSYNSTGNPQWIGSLGGNKGDYAFDIKCDVSDNLFLLGRFESSANFQLGSQTQILISSGMADAFLLKLSKSAQIEEFILGSTAIYPNPVHDKTTINLGSYYENIAYRIVNLNGQFVAEKNNLSGSEIELEMTNQAPGLYWITLQTDKGTQRLKVVKN